MGQIGYGVDQAFLWYRRNGPAVSHDVQVLAFVSADFDRMRYRSFMSYGKPVLAVEFETLVVRNVPVPYRSTAAEGHYSARGHAFVAQVIHRTLAGLDAVKERLGDAAPPR
jgi:hypothetical protein